MTAAVPAPDAAPSPVRTAFWLYIAGGVVAVLDALVTLLVLPSIIDATIARAQQQLHGQDTAGVDPAAIARFAAVFGVSAGAVLSVVFLVLTIVFARKMVRGRNWARIVLAAFAALRLFGVAGIGGNGVVAALLTSVGILVVVLAAVLTFLPVPNLWFRSMRPVRAPF